MNIYYEIKFAYIHFKKGGFYQAKNVSQFFVVVNLHIFKVNLNCLTKNNKLEKNA